MVRRTKKEDFPIPKKIHCIWLGPKEPAYFRKFIKTFKKFAPGYTIRVWKDSDLTKHNFPITLPYIKKIKLGQGQKIKEWTNQKTMFKTDDTPYTYSKWAQISDLMRYEIIYREGGYYFDANMFLVKDITKLFERKESFVGCNELGNNLHKSPILSNSFFGSIPNSPILKRLLTKSFLDQLDLRTLDVDFETGPGALRNAVTNKDKYYIFPASTFYPYILPWTSDGGDHPLRKSSKGKCSGPKRTKKRTLRMKDNIWLEFPCNKYKESYGIKVWESGGSWSRPSHWYEKSGSRKSSRYAYSKKQTGGVIPACVPCMANPVGLAVGVAGACAYGLKKGYDCIKNKSTKKKKKKKKTKKKKKKTKSK